MSRFSAVIFDLDGTLLDTLEDIGRAMNAVLEQRGRPPRPLDEYRHLVGEGMEALARRVLSEPEAEPDAIAEIVRDYRALYDRIWRENSRPYPGVRELLDGLIKRGLRTAVLSNKSHPFTVAMTRELLSHPFDVIRGARPGVPLKPDPTVALEIATAMGAPPNDMVFLGDTKVDMLTARAAGMVPAGALWGFRDAGELRASGAAVLLERPLDLLALIDTGA